jgi:hypothetical protein
VLRRTRTFLQQLTGSGSDRRLFTRHETSVETRCRALADNVDVVARLRNVSRTGVNLTVPREVPEGTMIRIDLPTGGPSTTVLACVTNAKAISETEWSLGCMFSLELSESEMKSLGGDKKAGSPPDQRAWVRYPAKGTVTFRLLPSDGNGLRAGELVDLSPSGVGLIVAEKIEPGSALTVTLRRVDDKPDRSLLACVVYLAERPDGKWALGCQFLHELTEKELEELLWRSTR